MLKAEYFGDGWTLTAQHDIPYDDGSGMGLQNFPDGVNTLSFSWKDKDRWVSDIVYEYHYTMYQSGPINREQNPDLFPDGKRVKLFRHEHAVIWKLFVHGRVSFQVVGRVTVSKPEQGLFCL